MHSEVLSRVQDRVGYVALNRPEARNAVYPELLDDVVKAIEAHDRDENVRVIVFTGEGKAFCAGADREKFLVRIPGKTPQEIQKDIYTRFMGVVRALRISSKPSVAAVNGAAVGAGCEFALACDFRVATPSALFWENWIDLAIIPPLGGTFVLPRLIGAGRAADMVMRSRRVSADEALAWGLVSEIMMPEKFAEDVQHFALSLAQRSPRALAIAKQALRRGAESGLDAELDFTLQAQSILLASADFAEAAAAIADNRLPVF